MCLLAICISSLWSALQYFFCSFLIDCLFIIQLWKFFTYPECESLVKYKYLKNNFPQYPNLHSLNSLPIHFASSIIWWAEVLNFYEV